MTPTQKLRWVKKQIVATGSNGCQYYSTEKVLQQWWESDGVDYKTFELAGEWRDVPVETEQ